MSSPLRDLAEAVARMAHVRPDGIATREKDVDRAAEDVETQRRDRGVSIDGGTTGEQ